MAKQEQEIKEDKPKARYELTEVPTQYGIGVRDNFTEEVIDSNQLLLRIANDLSEIKKSLA